MAALPTPQNLLVLNARPGGVTRFTQEGTGFNGTTVVTVTDENGVAADRYKFATESVVALSGRRLLVTVKCTQPTSVNRFRDGIIRVTTSTNGAAPDDSGPVAAIYLTRRQPQVDPARMRKAKLRLRPNAKTAVLVPVTGLGDTITATADFIGGKGTWVVFDVSQRRRFVRVVLQCLTTTVTTAATDALAMLLITLTAEDDTVVEVPPMELEYEDPDEDPGA